MKTYSEVRDVPGIVWGGLRFASKAVTNPPKPKLPCGCRGECDDMGHFWKDVKKERQEKRANNREQSPATLTARGIGFESKNYGAHLIVKHGGTVVDFWPGTGKWIDRSGKKIGRGVGNLITYLTHQEAPKP